jgi:hypothetical protein
MTYDSTASKSPALTAIGTAAVKAVKNLVDIKLESKIEKITETPIVEKTAEIGSKNSAKEAVKNLNDIKLESSLNGKSVSVNSDGNKIIPFPLVDPIIEDPRKYYTTAIPPSENDGNFNSDENNSRENQEKKTNERVYDDVICVKEISPAGKAALMAQDNEE